MRAATTRTSSYCNRCISKNLRDTPVPSRLTVLTATQPPQPFRLLVWGRSYCHAACSVVLTFRFDCLVRYDEYLVDRAMQGGSPHAEFAHRIPPLSAHRQERPSVSPDARDATAGALDCCPRRAWHCHA